MDKDYEDIDLSGVTIYNFLYIQGMRASRAREIYRLCVNDTIPQPTPVIFGDETDRERHALRRFRNALSMDLVPNVQFAYQQCALKDDGQGMTPEELQGKLAELEQSSLHQPAEDESCQAEERCATQVLVEQMPGFCFHRALLNGGPQATEKRSKTSSKLGKMKEKRQTQVLVPRLVRRLENTSNTDLRVNPPKATSTQKCRSAKATAFGHQAPPAEPKPPLTASQRNNTKPAVLSVRKQAPITSQVNSKTKSPCTQITVAPAAKDRRFTTLSRPRAQRVPLSFSSTTSATQTPPPELPVRRWR